ncbi:MAG: peptidylprolyl isomerase [Candidatus Marsarchaeota archaeon]|jgi:FKBP-type peptidyl-prolyl cis-trans isomerase 2|nr:peptidylprolyl isomerase [Candidatus Marsarchaeota archaeon]
MTFADGDFVKIEYSMWRVSDNSLMATTDRKIAEEKGIYNKEVRYGPMLVVIGKGSVFKKLENAIKEMDVGSNKKVELSPEEAYGERNKDLVRVMPISEFRKKNIDPMPGMQIEIDDAVATIMSVNSGRVMVDANHVLAGEKLLYEVKVVSNINNESERVKAVAESRNLEPEKVEVKEDMAKVSFGTKTNKDAQYFINKSSLVYSILDYLPKIKKVYIEEEYTKEENKQ